MSRPCEESRYFRHAHGSSQRVRKRHVHGCATPADAVAPTIDIVTELIEVNSLTEHDRAQRCALGAVNSPRAGAEEQRIIELATLTKELMPIPE